MFCFLYPLPQVYKKWGVKKSSHLQNRGAATEYNPDKIYTSEVSFIAQSDAEHLARTYNILFSE